MYDISNWHTIHLENRSAVENATIQHWCTEYFGQRWDPVDNSIGSWRMLWAGPDSHRGFDWHFKNSDNAVLFALRWA